MARVQDLVLFALGDSHCKFWSGHDRIQSGDILPGVGTHMIGAALAWNLTVEGTHYRGREESFTLARAARESGFLGWLLLSFGEIDMRNHVYKHALQRGLETVLDDIVGRYCIFLDELRRIYGSIAVWGPAASRPDHMPKPDSPSTGSEVERNFATMLFTEKMRKKLAARGIPFLSLFDTTLNRDGTTRWQLFWDGSHLSQRLLPSALALVKYELGLELLPPPDPLEFISTSIDSVAEILHHDGIEGTGFTFVFKGNIFIEDARIFPAAELAERDLYVTVSFDGSPARNIRLAPPNDQETRAARIVPIGAFTRRVSIASRTTTLDCSTVLFRGRAMRWSLETLGSSEARDDMRRLISIVTTAPAVQDTAVLPAWLQHEVSLTGNSIAG